MGGKKFSKTSLNEVSFLFFVKFRQIYYTRLRGVYVGRGDSIEWINDYQVWLSEEQSLQNAQLIVNYFMVEGTDWTRESLSAMLGNMRHESSINPNMYEYGYDWSEDRGFGLVQWTPRSKYWDWAISEGYSEAVLRDGDAQLARITYEIENNIQWIPRESIGNMTFAEFRSNSGNWDIAYLTSAFTWGYERPNQEAGEESMPDRIAFAQRCFDELDWSATPTPPTPTTSTEKTLIGLLLSDALNGWRWIKDGLLCSYGGYRDDRVFSDVFGG